MNAHDWSQNAAKAQVKRHLRKYGEWLISAQTAHGICTVPSVPAILRDSAEVCEVMWDRAGKQCKVEFKTTENSLINYVEVILREWKVDESERRLEQARFEAQLASDRKKGKWREQREKRANRRA